MSRFVLDMGGHRVRLREGLWRIGRDATCEVHLDDPSVSRRHASLRVSARAVEVLDAGSRHGVQVNGERIHVPTRLRGGDVLSVGTVRLRLLDQDPSHPDLEAPVTGPLPKVASSPPLEAPSETQALSDLSPREQEVLSRLAHGETQREIAEALGVSVKTVETYRSRIGRKLDLQSRADLVRFALASGVLATQGT